MIDGSGHVLYVGKAKAMRTRLLSYFRAQYPDDKQARILHAASDIVFDYTPSEFSAALSELKLHSQAPAAVQRRDEPFQAVRVPGADRRSGAATGGHRHPGTIARPDVRPAAVAGPHGRRRAHALRPARPAGLPGRHADALRRTGGPVQPAETCGVPAIRLQDLPGALCRPGSRNGLSGPGGDRGWILRGARPAAGRSSGARNDRPGGRVRLRRRVALAGEVRGAGMVAGGDDAGSARRSTSFPSFTETRVPTATTAST